MPFHVLQTLTSYDLKLFNRDQSDVRRGLEERIRLTLAMETGDGSLIASAITHRKQACKFNVTSKDYVTGYEVRPFSAMDVALLVYYDTPRAYHVLDDAQATLTRTAAGDGTGVVAIPEFEQLAELLPAVLASGQESIDGLLSTAPFSALLVCKMAVLWPLVLLEIALYLLLCICVGAFFMDQQWAALPSMLLAAQIAIAELLQALAAAEPLFGDPSARHLRAHILDPYNILDVLVAIAVFVTVGGGVPDPALKSVTILLLLLKLIG